MLVLRQSQSGFTLIEVLIAAIVLTIGLFGLVKFQIISINHTQAAQNRTIANTQLQNMVHLLRAVSQEALTAEITNWNISNEKLLLHGHGEIVKNQEGYRMMIAWDERDSTQALPQHVVISQNVVVIPHSLKSQNDDTHADQVP